MSSGAVRTSGGVLRYGVGAPMRVLSWNIQALRGCSPRRLAAITDAIAFAFPDVVLLQEVAMTKGFVDRVRAAMAAVGLTGFNYAGGSASSGKRYGSAIATRWAFEPLDAAWAAGAPWPQLLAGGTVKAMGCQVEVISVHVPNGSSNGWKKVETFEALADHLSRHRSGSRVVGGDFNEPRWFEREGRAISFGARIDKVGGWSVEGQLMRKGERHPRRRWNDAVDSVLGSGADLGLRHAYLATHQERFEETHRTRTQPRFFDHLLVSKDMEVLASGFHHAWRTDLGLSDHSAAWAELRPPS